MRARVGKWAGDEVEHESDSKQRPLSVIKSTLIMWLFDCFTVRKSEIRFQRKRRKREEKVGMGGTKSWRGARW